MSKLNLSPAVWPQIYLGQITNWDGAAIKKLNKDVALPNLAITPIYRSDGSGDTYAFTDLSASRQPDVGEQGRHRHHGQLPGRHRWQGQRGRVRGRRRHQRLDRPTSPRPTSPATASAPRRSRTRPASSSTRTCRTSLAAASAFPTVPANNEMHIVNPPKKAKTAYPLTTYTYAIVPTSAGGNASTLTSFIGWVISSGQAAGPALDFQPIPKFIYNADLNTLKQIH